VRDTDEGQEDADGDDIPNYLDEDSDGVPDEIEFLGGTNAYDLDNPDSTLIISPLQPIVTSPADVLNIEAFNLSTLSLTWQAVITQGANWLSIADSGGGVDDGIISVVYETNPDPLIRTASIRVTAPGAVAFPRDIIVTQEGCPVGASPNNVLAISVGRNIEITWDAVSDAVTYDVFRSRREKFGQPNCSPQWTHKHWTSSTTIPAAAALGAREEAMTRPPSSIGSPHRTTVV